MMRLRYEQIPLTSNSLDILVAGAKLQELLADTPNDDLKGFNPLVDGGFPDLIVYLFIGKNLSGMPCEKIQHVEFKGGKVSRFLP